MLTSNFVNLWDMDIAPALREYALTNNADFEMCCDFVSETFGVKMNEWIIDGIYDICEECAV